MGLFDNVNTNVQKTPSSSIDLRLLDVNCNHQIIDETVVFDAVNLFGLTAYSSGPTFSSGPIYSSFDPNKFVYVQTKLPYVKNNFISFTEQSYSTYDTPIQETVTLPVASYVNASGITVFNFPFAYKLLYPPKPNSLSIKYILTTNSVNCGIDDIQTTYKTVPPENYTVAQIGGTVNFVNVNDASDPSIPETTTVIISYVAQPRTINPNTKQQIPNYEFVGFGKNNIGIFKIYARAFNSTNTTLFIRYTTIPEYCPRCAGSLLVNDLNFDEIGRVSLVYDFIKLIQDYFKNLLTSLGSNPFNSDDGSQFPYYVGLKKINTLNIDQKIRNVFLNVLAKVRAKQKIQAPIQGISDAEQIAVIQQLKVYSVSPTDVNVEMTVQSKSNDIALLKSTQKG